MGGGDTEEDPYTYWEKSTEEGTGFRDEVRRGDTEEDPYTYWEKSTEEGTGFRDEVGRGHTKEHPYTYWEKSTEEGTGFGQDYFTQGQQLWNYPCTESTRWNFETSPGDSSENSTQQKETITNNTTEQFKETETCD